MEVRLVLPDSLKDYLEYIPASELPNVLTDVLVRHIHEASIEKEYDSGLVNMLLEKVSGLQIQAQAAQVTTQLASTQKDLAVVIEEKKSVDTTTVVQLINNDDDDDDAAELFSLMK